MPDVRPGPSATPFRVTIYGLGSPRTFPMYADAAYENAKQAALWRADAPFSPEIFDHLDNRDVLAGSITRVILALAKRDGVLFWTDDDGHLWGILGRTISGVEVDDPEARDRKGKPKVGFAFDPKDASVSEASLG